MIPARFHSLALTTAHDPLALCFPAQREMVEALLQPGARVADHSGRGSGKTEGVAHGCQKLMRSVSGCKIAWIGLTRKSAMDNVWPVMRRVNDAFGQYLSPKAFDGRWHSPNNGTFAVFGANKADEIEKLRGQAFHLVIIDESASFKRSLLKYLVEDVIEPRLVDYNGSLGVIGTPGAATAGYYYDICKGKGGFKVFRRTMLDNPHFRNAADWMRQQRERKGWDEDHPTYRREYSGEWVLDTDSLVYKFSREKNLIDRMPDDYSPRSPNWTHLLSIDFGVVDSTAWTIWSWRKDRSGDRRAFIPISFKWHAGIPERFYEGLGVRPGDGRRPGDDLGPSDTAEITQRIAQEFGAYPIVGDTGGIGKGFQVEARKRFGIDIRPADKADMHAGIELLNDGLRTSEVQLVEENNKDLIEEFTTAQWKTELYDQSVGGVIRREERRVVDKRFEIHLCDAARYGYPEVRAYRNTAPPPKPAPTPDDVIARHRKKQFRKQRAQAAGEWWM